MIPLTDFVIETDRLLLRPFTLDDVDALYSICANPAVMRYIGDGNPLDTKTVQTQITNWIHWYEQQGYGLLALVLKENRQLIGFCGLLHQTLDGEDFIELGYRLDHAFWGEGLATEAALAVKNYALHQLKIPILISIIHHENKASKKVATKIGMKFMKKTTYKTIVVDVFCLNIQ